MELNKKIISLDLQSEELKQVVRVDRRKSTEAEEVKKMRIRQNDFMIREAENKAKKLEK